MTQEQFCLNSYSLESVLDIFGSEKYGCEVIATQNCDNQCVLYIIEPKKCDLDMIGTETVFFDSESVLDKAVAQNFDLESVLVKNRSDLTWILWPLYLKVTQLGLCYRLHKASKIPCESIIIVLIDNKQNMLLSEKSKDLFSRPKM